MATIRIGYQGREGSFSEFAAKQLAEECGLTDVVFIPKETALAVINSLREKTIEYALLATRNSTGGNVEETMRVITNTQFQLKRATVIRIHQCLFKLREDIPDKDITHIVSHIQALRQTEKYRKNKFPHAVAEENEDTAKAAIQLANGELDPHCAVICSLEAGYANGLHLYEKNIEDDKKNRTEFRLVKLPDEKYVTEEGFDEAITRNHFITEHVGKGLAILLLALALWGLNFFEGPLLAKVSSLCGYLLVVYLTYKWIINHFNKKALTGYWKYYSKPFNNTDEAQLYHVPRIVDITERDGHFRLEAYTNNVGMKRQINAVGEPAYSFETGSSRGIFYYKYSPGEQQVADVSGSAVLEWYKKHPWSKITTMRGNYFGIRSQEIGAFTFYRISEEEFNDIQLSRFLID